jgi:hypothetical protein
VSASRGNPTELRRQRLLVRAQALAVVVERLVADLRDAEGRQLMAEAHGKVLEVTERLGG